MIIPATTTKTFLLGIVLVVLVLFSACSSEPTVTVSTRTVGSKTEPTPTPIIIYITVTVVVTATPTISPPPTSAVVPTVRAPEATATITPATPTPTRPPTATPTKLPANRYSNRNSLSYPYAHIRSDRNCRRSLPIANHRTNSHTNHCSAGILNPNALTWHNSPTPEPSQVPSPTVTPTTVPATTAPQPSATSTTVFDPLGEDRNCGEFVNWQQAQDFYLAAGGPDTDPHGLDGVSDGTACESLTGAP